MGSGTHQILRTVIARQCQALPFGTAATADRPGSHRRLLQLGQLPLQADLVTAISASDKPAFLNSGLNTSHLASSLAVFGRTVAATETCYPEGVLGAYPLGMHSLLEGKMFHIAKPTIFESTISG